jgi:hypothetical protein
MSTTPTAIAAEQENLLQRVKGAFGAGFFLLLQLSPQLVRLYRNERSWTLFRVAMGCFGAALVILPLSLWHGYFTAVAGLVMFVVSILLPPAELESATDRKARELGVQTVVSGGEYHPANAGASNAGAPLAAAGDAPGTAVQLFISPSQIWALAKNFEPLVVITTAEISSLDVEPREDRWLLRVRWNERKAEFVYKGIFAERFARLAEESLRQANLSTQPKQDKRRAARA